MTLPYRHRSTFDVIGPLPGVAFESPEEETPLFAADPSFARANGGQITRAFVDSLPSAWGDDLVIHSSLVWLTTGLAHDVQFGTSRGAPQRDPPPFRHEPFPAWTSGVRDAANRNREAVHRVLVVGGESPVFASGMIQLHADEDVEEFWLPRATLQPRDRRLRAWLTDGKLTANSPPNGNVVQCSWGTFWCPQPAVRSGFQLVLWATHRDVCLPVNGLRNVSFM